jgi:hypothetical protein
MHNHVDFKTQNNHLWRKADDLAALRSEELQYLSDEIQNNHLRHGAQVTKPKELQYLSGKAQKRPYYDNYYLIQSGFLTGFFGSFILFLLLSFRRK